MLYSFIIPTKNEEAYIGPCLESILNQTQKNAEIIVVDSESADETVAIAQRLGATIVSEPRKGPAIARNTGAQNAHGDILIFADADVRFQPDFLEQLDANFKTLGGALVWLNVYDAPAASIKISYGLANALVRFLDRLGCTMTLGSCFIFEKNVFSAVGGFDQNLFTNEDHDLARRVAAKKRVRYFSNIRVGTSSRRLIKNGLWTMIIMYAHSTCTYFLNHKPLRTYWQEDTRTS